MKAVDWLAYCVKCIAALVILCGIFIMFIVLIGGCVLIGLKILTLASGVVA